jgi:lipopolysaccharide/colanic/teichoic acid biosynthesis glycosyltransferase
VGRGGQRFWVIKFRSMVVDAEKHVGTVWAAENDPRITPAGRLLRKMRLDEFPQFWNILRGDMSLIGPRPERPYFVDQLVQQYPFYRVRHAVKPGLTGWAQVKYRYGASLEDSLMKLQYDLYYIKRQGIALDFEILLKTISVVLGLKGR